MTSLSCPKEILGVEYAQVVYGYGQGTLRAVSALRPPHALSSPAPPCAPTLGQSQYISVYSQYISVYPNLKVSLILRYP